MISTDEAIGIHKLLIDTFGGSKGIRDKDALQSALFRPYQTFEEKELYPSPENKASAMLEIIISNHPYLDGNKRIGYVLMRLILIENGTDIKASEEEKFEFILEVAKGKVKLEQIKAWIQLRLIKNVL
ncbi:MAG: type II toxin-antitoxin system death-on-curing family toxin [Saprospiraceae bacterium]|uniref:Type II toxin-antitoxin system death-on-curing family toxin n=1 Tax=Candidatus Opimibacter skivensis TaxID=2982028 RepID=A0A9D7SRU8_9BACT|nr:type II toxin-antitoxin system death-on-curing family toxin [Candidatus Opimibacter skivensis]